MDTDALKRRIAQELNDQFEGKLREARREKTEMEEELESASERWRSERRRLNTEIDRLEAALTETKATIKKPSESREDVDGNAAAEWANTLAAAEDRLASASSEWESERARLQAEVDRLQGSVTEILERSNNPVRSLHAVQQKLENQLHDAVGARQRIEDDFTRAKASWEEERLKMAGELFRVKRGSASSDASDSSNNEALQRARTENEQLRRQLAEAHEAPKSGKAAKSRDTEKLHELTQKNTELAENLQQARDEVRQLEAKLEEAGKAAGDKASKTLKARHAAQVEEIQLEKAALAAELEHSTTQLEHQKRRAADVSEELQDAQTEIRRLERRVEESREAAQSEVADAIGAQYAAEMEAIVKEKATLEGKLESAGAMLKQARELRAQFESQLSELADDKTQAVRELETASAMLDEEKRHSATLAQELQATRTEAQQAERQTAKRDAGGKKASEELRAEFESQLAELTEDKTHLTGQVESIGALLDQERQMFAAANNELEKAETEIKNLRRKLTETGAGSEGSSPQLQELAEQLEKANAALAQEKHLASALNEELRRARHKAQQLERRGAMRAGGGSDDQIDEISKQLEDERQKLTAANDELRRARMETEQLERRLGETGNAVNSDVIEQLRSQYAAKLQEIADERTELAARLEGASTLLEQERRRFANAADGGTDTIDGSALEVEVTRVEGAIAEITRFIDDPSAQLAAVIRKNVERAELDAYLKGILFARGVAKTV